MQKKYEKVAEASTRIKAMMEEREMRQIDLAKACGLNKQQIHGYVSGRYEPKQDALFKMGQVLDVADMWLAGYDVPQERPQKQKESEAERKLLDRIKKDQEFKTLIMQISDLNPEQLVVVIQLLNQFRRD